MNVSELIIATLQEKGHANMRQLLDALHVAAGPAATCHCAVPLHSLIREGRVSASCGVYTFVK